MLYVVEGSGREKCHLLGSCPSFSHFLHFLKATGALPAAVLVLIPWVGGLVYVVGPSNGLSWEIGSFFHCRNPTDFMDRGYSQCWNPGLHSLSWGWNCSFPSCSPQFLSTLECRTAHSASRLAMHPLHPSCLSSPLLPVWMNVSFWTHWLLDFHTVQLFWQFWLIFVFRLVVILLMVVWGGEAYLSMPPSWPEVSFFL